MASLGFEYIELSHGIRISLVPGILKALQEGMAKVTTTHNFCPLPTGITVAAPNLFMPSSGDPREVEQWLRHTRRSIDFAQQIGAKLVVLHLGQVDFFWLNPGRKLRRLANGRTPEHPAHRKLVERSLAKLRKRLPSYWARVLAGLETLLPYAAERGVLLGLENREKFEELPVDDDFPALLAGLSRPDVAGYWHDTGHAHIKQTLGLVDHRRQLEANADRLLGFHLHDVDAENRDHLPVGAGQIDWNMIGEFIRPHHLLTLELSPRVSPENLQESKRRIEAMIG